MKRTHHLALFVLLAILFCVQTAMANNNRKAGIGFRAAHWRMSDTPATIEVTTSPYQSHVDVGSGGGYLTFFSRVSDASWIEFNLGAVGRVETHDEYFFGEETDVNAVMPVLLGLRHDLFSYSTQSSLIPYIALGVGPYFFNDVYVKTEYFGVASKAQVKTKGKMGGYAGGGLNFMMTDWFGFNFDARYHFVEFDLHNDRSGWEYSLGVLFAWGRYKQPVYRSKRRYHRHRDEVNIYID